jgi:hypothetical protein
MRPYLIRGATSYEFPLHRFGIRVVHLSMVGTLEARFIPVVQ